MAGFHHPSVRSDHDVAWLPNTDVIEHGDGLVVRVELAGVNYESIRIVITDGALVLSGMRVNPHSGSTAAGYRFRQMEIEYGPFERVLPLPYPIQHQLAKARCRGGMLEIDLPRASAHIKSKTLVKIQW